MTINNNGMTTKTTGQQIPDSPVVQGPESGQWLERYSRQILLKEVGGQGQKRLCHAVVGIISTGTINTTLIRYLAAAGVGRLEIVNYGNWDAREQIAATHLNSSITITLLEPREPPGWSQTQMASWDLVVVAGQPPAIRQTASIMAQHLGKPLLGSWCVGEHSIIRASRAGYDHQAPCLFCPEPETVEGPTRTAPPITTPLTTPITMMAEGVVGSILAMESLKILLDIGQGLWHTQLTFHPETGFYQQSPTQKNPNCQLCNGPHHV